MRFVIAAAYSYSLKKGRVVIDKDVDLVESHQYSEGNLGTVCALDPAYFSCGNGMDAAAPAAAASSAGWGRQLFLMDDACTLHHMPVSCYEV